MTDTADLIARYYAAFNAGDTAGMLACLAEDVRHDVNQGGARHGKAAFAEFCAHMSRCYRERLEDIVIMTGPGDTRAAAEFTVHGAYLATDEGLPPAAGQTYTLPGGTFFEIADGRIARVTTYYNLADWTPAGHRVTLRVEPLTGAALAAALPQVARLRIEVFRAFPYLYDGDIAYEENYLAKYAASPGAIVAGAWDGERLVGAATAAPMEDHAAEFAAPFAERGYDLANIFYCGESVLLPEYRGRRVGHAFFDLREAQGRALGRRLCCFCAVIRPADHPLRPADYAPLDPFWRKRGYAKMKGMVATFPWKDLGDAGETAKPMQFWMKDL